MFTGSWSKVAGVCDDLTPSPRRHLEKVVAISGNVQVEAGREKPVAIPQVPRLAQKVFQEPRAPGEGVESERQVTLRPVVREVDGDEAQVFARSPQARHEILLALVALPSHARLDLSPHAFVEDRVRERREQTPVVLFRLNVRRLIRAASEVHGELHAPALQLTLVQKAQTRERER